MLSSTLYIIGPMQFQSLRLLRLMVKNKMHLQENTLFDLWPDLGVKVTLNFAEYPLHSVTYAGIKFEVDTSR